MSYECLIFIKVHFEICRIFVGAAVMFMKMLIRRKNGVLPSNILEGFVEEKQKSKKNVDMGHTQTTWPVGGREGLAKKPRLFTWGEGCPINHVEIFA